MKNSVYIDNMTCGKRLRNLRGIRTQTGVAKEIGITKQRLSQYERGVRRPLDKEKVKLARYYGMTVEDIFFTQ